jgi:hypothetical protein
MGDAIGANVDCIGGPSATNQLDNVCKKDVGINRRDDTINGHDERGAVSSMGDAIGSYVNAIGGPTAMDRLTKADIKDGHQ